MTQPPRSVPISRLTGDLVDRLARLVSVEIRLMRAELAESSARALSGIGWVAGAFCLLLAGLVMLLAAAAALLTRLGLAPDVACLLIAAAAITIGAALAAFGLGTFKKVSFVPKRALRQIASLGQIMKGN